MPPTPAARTELFSVGLKTAHGKYLNVDKAGGQSQLSAKAPKLTTKSAFVLETKIDTWAGDANTPFYAFRAHTGHYLSWNKDTLVCEKAEKGDTEWFRMTFENGLVTLHTGYQLSPNDPNWNVTVDGSDTIKVHKSSAPDANEVFDLEINMHPQICLSTSNKYIGLDNLDKDIVVSNRKSQFGKETLITMEPGITRGQFTLKMANHKYLGVDGAGKVTAEFSDKGQSTLFTFSLHGEFLALWNVMAGGLLTPLGNGLKIANVKVPSSKELFAIHDSDAQVTLKAENGKYVATQGSNLITNKTAVGHEEIFLMEFHGEKVAFKAEDEKYWTANDDGSLVLTSKTVGPNELFSIEYHDTKIALKSNSGQYITAAKLGGVSAKGKAVSTAEQFEAFLYNRDQVVLKSDFQTYVATGPKGDVVSVNAAKPEVWDLSFKDGKYSFRNTAGKYWQEGEGGKIVLGDEPHWFLFHFPVHTKISLVNGGGKFLTAEKTSSWLVAKADHSGPTEQFEF